MSGIKLKACPFCGNRWAAADPDVMHPSGGWFDDSDGRRHYVPSSDSRKQGSCYEIHCVRHYGGCGASLSGDSIKEVCDLWNTRADIFQPDDAVARKAERDRIAAIVEGRAASHTGPHLLTLELNQLARVIQSGLDWASYERSAHHPITPKERG